MSTDKSEFLQCYLCRDNSGDRSKCDGRCQLGQRHVHLFSRYGCWCRAKRWERIAPKWWLRFMDWLKSQMEPKAMSLAEHIEDRFYSPLCEESKHEECAKSSYLGICGCECHDYLDELDAALYGETR